MLSVQIPARETRLAVFATGVCLAALLAARPLAAQSLPDAEGPADQDVTLGTVPGSAAREVYSPEDFTRFGPRSALDMLEQVPGFRIEAEDRARGLGQASGNVLINGERLSSKSTGVRDQLARIAVGDVVRIEIVDGAALGLPGLSGRVADVITRSAGTSGRFSWTPLFSTGPAPINWTEGQASLTGSRGRMDYTLALDSIAFARGNDGPNRITTGAGVIDDRWSEQRALFRKPELSARVTVDLGPGVVANLGASGNIARFWSDEDEERIGASPLAPLTDILRSTNREHGYELSGDIAFPIAGGQLKLIGLESYEHGNLMTRTLLTEAGAPTTGSLFTRERDTGERIGRGEYSWKMLDGDWQLSAEAAFNRLDNVALLYAYDDGLSDYVQLDFPAGIGGVREKRYETLLSYSRSLTSRLSLQIVAGGEYSRISQTGSNALSRGFRRPKGSLSLAWAAQPGLDISFEIARRVGQLDFADFLANVNLSEANQNAGNNQLRPQQSWETEVQIARNLGRWGSATLTLFDERVEDFVTIVPVGGGLESTGNVDRARRYGLRFTGTVEMAPIGLQGAKLDINLSAERSSLPDPLTGRRRGFDSEPPREIRFDFRHDIPASDWAWGAEFRDTKSAPYFRIAEFGYDTQIPRFGAVFVEHKDVLGMTVKARVANLFQGGAILQRDVFAGPRDSAPLLYREDRRRKVGLVFNVYVSGSF